MGYLTKQDESPIPTLEDIMQAHEALGSLLKNHYNGVTPPPKENIEMPNKLGIIAAPTQPIRK